MTARAETRGRYALATAVAATRQHRILVGVGLAALALPLVPFFSAGFELQVPILWVMQFVLFAYSDPRAQLVRVATKIGRAHV